MKAKETMNKHLDNLPLTLRKKGVALEVSFSADPEDNFMINIQIRRLSTGLLTRTHCIIRPDFQQWLNLYLDDNWGYYFKKSEQLKNESYD